jgi:hypothetical protein
MKRTLLWDWPMPYRNSEKSGGGSGGDQPPAPPEGGEDGGGTPPGSETLPATFEEFLKGQPEAVQTLYTEDVKGLKSALSTVRQEREDLQKQLKDLSARLDKGSDAQKQVDELSGQLETASQRTAFYEDAADAGVTNFRLAWLVVQDSPDDYLDRQGRVNFDLLKERNPELFKEPKPSPPKGNAGKGTQTPPKSGPSMNAIIRSGARGEGS